MTGVRLRAVLVTLLLAFCASAASPAEGSGEDFDGTLERAAHAVFTRGNRVRIVLDPEEAYRVRIEAVRSARHHVLLSIPIWRTDAPGRRFLDEFTAIVREKIRENPRFAVYVEMDTVTFLPSHDLLGTIKRRLRRAGAHVRFFNPSTWIVTATYEARQHDKLLVVDGRLAILGGRNIGGEYFETGRHWTDLDAVVEGPAVAELQMMFLKTWTLMGRWNVLHNACRPPEQLLRQARRFWGTGHFSRIQAGRSPLDRFFRRGFFPEETPFTGGVRTLVLWDMPLVYRRAPTLDVLLLLIRNARDVIDMVTPYSTLPKELTTALGDAVRRGVRVRFITSSREHHNYGLDGWLATVPVLDRLAASGVTVYGWAPDAATVPEGCAPLLVPGTLLHGKLVQIDGRWGIVHSSNFNYRSSYYNTESGILVDDPSFAGRLREIVDRLTGEDGQTGPCFPLAARKENAGALHRAFLEHRSRIESLEHWSFVQ